MKRITLHYPHRMGELNRETLTSLSQLTQGLARVHDLVEERALAARMRVDCPLVEYASSYQVRVESKILAHLYATVEIVLANAGKPSYYTASSGLEDKLMRRVAQEHGWDTHKSWKSLWLGRFLTTQDSTE